MVPQLEEMGADIGQRARVLPHKVQVLLGQLPHSRAAALKEGRVVQVPLWEEGKIKLGARSWPLRSLASYRTGKSGKRSEGLVWAPWSRHASEHHLLKQGYKDEQG